jgi:WD40 repeat protein
MQILKGHLAIKPVRSLAFAPDGASLASSARDYKTFLWDLSTGKHQVIERSNSYTVAFSPDGKTVATGRTSDVVLWNADTRQSRVLDTGYDRGHGIEIAFTRDGQTMITVSGTVRLWSLSPFAPLAVGSPLSPSATNALALSRDGTLMATGHDRPFKCVRLWSVADWSVQREVRQPTATVTALAISPDKRFVAAAAGTTLWVWESASGEVVVKHTIDLQHYKDVAFSPDGRFLLFARNDATVRLWETSTWTEAAAYDWKIGPMLCVAFAPDGMRAAGGSGKGKVVVWDIDL